MKIALRRRTQGFTLVELVLFIVIVAVVAAAMFQAFVATMRGSHYGKQLTQATQLAQQRMEVILGQRKTGFSTFTAATYDPCPPIGAWVISVCTTTTYGAGNFVVTSSFSSACGADCREVTVTVTSPYGGVLASLTSQVWNY